MRRLVRAALAGGAAIAASASRATPVRETMPDIGALISVGSLTYLLAVLAGVVVALAPLLTLHRLRRADMSATLRVVE